METTDSQETYEELAYLPQNIRLVKDNKVGMMIMIIITYIAKCSKT